MDYTKLKGFNSKGYLDKRALPYYTHMNSLVHWFVNGNQPDQCYFCNLRKRPYPSVKDPFTKDWKILQDPVHPDELLLGGDVNVCADCYIDLDFLFHYDRIRCYNCREFYRVTKDETKYRERLMLLDNSRFLCPVCVSKEVLGYSADDAAYDVDSAVNVKDINCYKRYIHYSCECCSRKTSIDRYMSSKYLNALFLKYQGMRFCEVCSYVKRAYGLQSLMLLVENHTYIVIVERQDQKDLYNGCLLEVSRISTKISSKDLLVLNRGSAYQTAEDLANHYFNNIKTERLNL